MIDHRRRPDDPGIGLPPGVAPLLGAEDVRFLLRLPDEQHALVAVEAREILLGEVVFALALLEGHQVNGLRRHKALDRGDKSFAHRRDHHRRRHDGAELRLHEVDEAAARLQRRDVGIEIHPVDRFQLEGHVIREDLSDVFAYHDGGAPGEHGPCGHRPKQGLYLRRRGQPLPAPGAPLPFR